jgi:hypothetical protein
MTAMSIKKHALFARLLLSAVTVAIYGCAKDLERAR